MNEVCSIDFNYWVKKVFEEKVSPDDGFLCEEDITEILDADAYICDEEPRKSIFGYPTRPLHREIAARLKEWMETRSCPFEKLPNYHLLDEKDYHVTRTEMTKELTPRLESMRSLFPLWSEDERLYNFKYILQKLGKRGILDLLGMRRTVGSCDYFPPPRKTLEATFLKRNTDSQSLLTVGGRAFTKHSHRDHSSSWWGVSTGSEEHKNNLAFSKMTDILDHATWLNIHYLPGQMPTVEARQENGYGVRWTCNGDEFRGFLEPQMADGHEVGWKH